MSGGRVQLRYDLGSGIANLTTEEAVTPGEWHVARITRDGPRGTLQLDSGPKVEGSSKMALTELNLELPLYIGGFRFAHSISRYVKARLTWSSYPLNLYPLPMENTIYMAGMKRLIFYYT